MNRELLNTLSLTEITADTGSEIFDDLEKKWPKFISSKRIDDTLTLSLHIVQDIYWFNGHFPDKAVLPGVAQVHWAAEIAKLLVGKLARFKSARNVKFKKMILPNEKVELVLVLNTIKNTVVFTYKNKDNIYSTGSLLFESK
jgi:3-hydroxymyristoyl/3-hydroxydecanoyl-(acyl carrier protein) dehydratase